jgi:hypothetical protein
MLILHAKNERFKCRKIGLLCKMRRATDASPAQGHGDRSLGKAGKDGARFRRTSARRKWTPFRRRDGSPSVRDGGRFSCGFRRCIRLRSPIHPQPGSANQTFR